jgi:CheY-like chemotaxis protein
MENKRVLVVDDDLELCEGISELLRDSGYDVQNTTDSVLGKEIIQDHHFDIILADYKISGTDGLNGIDLLKFAKNKNFATKVFIVSGRPFIEKLVEAEQSPCKIDGVITKPFKDKDLLERIG